MTQIHLRVTQSKRTVEMTFTDTGDSAERLIRYTRAVLGALEEQSRQPEITIQLAPLRTAEPPQPCMDCGPGLENTSKVLTG